VVGWVFRYFQWCACCQVGEHARPLKSSGISDLASAAVSLSQAVITCNGAACMHPCYYTTEIQNAWQQTGGKRAEATGGGLHPAPAAPSLALPLQLGARSLRPKRTPGRFCARGTQKRKSPTVQSSTRQPSAKHACARAGQRAAAGGAAFTRLKNWRGWRRSSLMSLRACARAATRHLLRHTL
jgi:hypothetical protein